ncbi:MAG: ABC transporter permease [Lachnospiraceae bacterium]|nr:ABC transporter permease [Lachnospiraceae bacterium]
MFIAFGNIMEKDELFHEIPVAFVKEEGASLGLSYMLEAMGEGEEAMLSVQTVTAEEAQKLLDDKKVEGIIYEDGCKLVVLKESMNSTILEEILLLYKQNETVMMDMLASSTMQLAEDAASVPGDLEELVKGMTERATYYKEVHFTEGSQNKYYNYFYAIFAMSCLFASFSAMSSIGRIQADCGALGMRRNMVPTHKMLTIVAEFTALLLIQFLAEVIALGYMALLGMDFGSRIPFILLILFFGVSIGLAIGTIVGSVKKIPEAGKVGICVAVGMVLSVLADLCVGGLKHQLELHAPIINRINPAALITDSFYSLGVYDDYGVLFRNVATLGIETVILLVIAYLMVKKSRYKEL